MGDEQALLLQEQLRRDLQLAVECSPAAAGAAREVLQTMGLPDELSDVASITKAPDERMGCTWTNSDAELSAVADGSPAECGGLRHFVGRRCSHVNGESLRSVAHIAAACAGSTKVELRFAPRTVVSP